MRNAAAFLPLLALAGLACSPGESSKGKVNEEALAIAVQKNVDDRERFEQELQRYQARVTELENEVVDLRARLGIAEHVATSAQEDAEAATADRERYQAGLDRAVGELNRVSQQQAVQSAAATAAASAARAQPARPASGGPNISYYSSPRISIVDRSVVASGRLHNSGEGEAVGELQLSLVRDGEVLETKTQPFTVYGDSWGEWAETFTITPVPSAHYTVRARLVL